MNKVGIFFGSSTGNTESVANQLKEQFGDSAELFDVSSTPAEKVSEFTCVILGASTWGVGDLQDDMEGFLSNLSKVNLQGKKVALFGLGDQSSYGDTFCDGMGHIYSALQGKGCDIIGSVSTDGYDFEASIAEDDGDFVGLALDEDNQPDLTSARISSWVEALKREFA